MNRYLGIDMGGTASRFVLVDRAGALLARGKAAGATGHLFNPAAKAAFSSAIAEIAAQSGGEPVTAVHIGATGLGPRAHGEAFVLLSAAFGTGQSAITLSDDMELAFRAAFMPGAGHLISAGTGSVGLHLAADETMVRVGGRGILIDDGGSGTWIALRALDRLYRIHDETGGFANASMLADALFDAVGGGSWDDVRAFIYGADRGAIGKLARPVAAAADAGDPLAQTIMAEAAGELARLGFALIARAGEHPIGFVGGLLDISPHFKPALRKALQGHSVVFPVIDAALEAAKLALARGQSNRN